MENLEAVYSHVHALGQCRTFIQKHRLLAVVTGDTAPSSAPKEFVKAGSPSSTSIAPQLSLSIYDCHILAELYLVQGPLQYDTFSYPLTETGQPERGSANGYHSSQSTQTFLSVLY